MCLMAYEDNLSVGCALGIVEAAMALEAGLLAIDYSIKACEADADEHCLDIEAGDLKPRSTPILCRLRACAEFEPIQVNHTCSP